MNVKIITLILCCFTLSSCGLATRVITAPIKILVDAEQTEQQDTALAFDGQ